MKGKFVLLAVCGGLVVGMSVRAFEKPPAEYVTAMKSLNTANTALRAAVTAKDYDALAKNADIVKASYDLSLKFWTDRKTEDAIGFAKAGVQMASDLQAAVKAKDDAKIADAQKAIAGSCAGCHTAHRQRNPDMTYDIK